MTVEIPTELLEPFLSQPGKAAVITDFDGTLAPIVDDPEASRPLPGASEALDLLAGQYRRVAVVSGRPLSFLRERLACGPRVVLRGIYGMEVPAEGAITEDAEAEAWRDAVAVVAARADAEAPPGIGVERKGLSVTLHYRSAPELAPWADQWSGRQADTTGLARHPGRMSWELVPPIAVDKGTTVLGLGEGCEAVCFLGDDRGDLPAFHALDELSRRGAKTLKVVVMSNEVPAELLQAADLTVDGPAGALDVLRQLALP